MTTLLWILLGGLAMSAISLILLGDGLHNLPGGLSIGGVLLLDVRLGVAAWLAAAAHEIPQELGDFAVLIHGGWSKRSALCFNFLSGSTFLVGRAAAREVLRAIMRIERFT